MRKNQKGFTLIEVLVAIFIGLIVMGMAVAILGVTNSVSIRVLSKSEAQQNVRNSVVKLLDNLSNAQSLETCRVARNASDQQSIETGSNGSFAGACQEFVRTGNIIAWAAPNRVCYFDKQVGNINTFPDLRCITRGHTGAYDASQGNTTLAGSAMNLTNCVSHIPGGTTNDPDLIYMFTCSPNGGSRGQWPTNFLAPNTNSEFVIADIGLDDGANTTPTVPTSPTPVFTYVLENNANSTQVSGATLINVVAIKIDFDVRFKNNKLTEVGTFSFDQTVILKDSNKATEEEYDG